MKVLRSPSLLLALDPPIKPVRLIAAMLPTKIPPNLAEEAQKEEESRPLAEPMLHPRAVRLIAAMLRTRQQADGSRKRKNFMSRGLMSQKRKRVAPGAWAAAAAGQARGTPVVAKGIVAPGDG
tara:strand:- start:317 stop:685 length:369 start_codon:yes stop_codon:yes gene_type:complete